MRYETRLLIGASLCLLLSSCGGGDPQTIPAAEKAPVASVSDFPVKLGSPFTVGATTYTPEDTSNYDEVGFASWYGKELQGNQTANGETFVPGAITAAHKTLPMPSYVEVTALDTGRTILVRINDRGPMANDRLIDLSEGAARQLGISEQGLAPVRVRRVNPPEQDRAVLRANQPAGTRLDTPESLLKVLRDKLAKMPKPETPKVAAPEVVTTPPAKPVSAPAKVTTKPATTKTPAIVEPAKSAVREVKAVSTKAGYVVQVAAFSSKANADQLAAKLDAKVVASADGKLHRVRFGPFASESEAKAALKNAQAKGYPQARLLRE
ncbi:septal ring lytic transglycosylase RlpA family protein [Sphingorhabdus pulchriflava]|uniref:Endolytic peptidoglycan transglycosylase RlpA n=1 Tax=Sphingorhabdus pulchriflava TaxID=2292257 RepID=A0A371BGX9_9SPHN|nr:septal ring lytic transglycosylase RlpA family protein [Sphingorhabdus pulchriflava]RDV06854.1 septal ring lytic transglycosylase RlpA family protein [Sphingorhabdus pulchriflava]